MRLVYITSSSPPFPDIDFFVRKTVNKVLDTEDKVKLDGYMMELEIQIRSVYRHIVKHYNAKSEPDISASGWRPSVGYASWMGKLSDGTEIDFAIKVDKGKKIVSFDVSAQVGRDTSKVSSIRNKRNPCGEVLQWMEKKLGELQ
jgi:hypothetical protein